MATDAALSGPPAPVRMTALSLAAVAAVLSRSGPRPVTEEMLRQDLAAGAPSNADGTLNLIHYAAWLVQALQAGLAGKELYFHGD